MVAESSIKSSSNSSCLAEDVMVKLKALHPLQQQEVLNFIESLIQKNQSTQSIWDKIESRIAQVPEEVLAELPTDASENLDHYLYGVPKN